MEHYSYDQALNNSIKYFDGDELAAKVFVDKYALRDNNDLILEDTPEKMHRRIAKELSRIEKKKFKKPLSEDEIFSYLDKFKKIIPQGSMMFGIGNKYQYCTLSNCYVINSPTDSYGGICQTDEQLVQISKRRGGNGTDISHIRPAGLPVKNSSRTTTGIIPFMRRFSNSIREVGQGGRRGALMLTISIHHPQVLDFASVKRDKNEITGANISIKLTDEFLNAVDKDLDYEQRWPVDSENPSVSRKVKARDVWKKIIENAHNMAEPGLLFWDNIIKESPSDCYKKYGFGTVSTNPCSEIPLSIFDSCRLIVINLYSYVRNPFTDKAFFDYTEFYRDCGVMQRLIDDAVDLEIECIDRIIEKIHNDPEPENTKKREIELWSSVRNSCINGRRTGSGTTALGDTLAALNIKYGSVKSLDIVDQIFKTLKLGCYSSSVAMAQELGAFPIWDHELENNNPFLLRIKDEDPVLWARMKEYGRRNIAILTSAPTGSVSILTQTSSGIEPVFQLFYTRRKKITHEDKNVKVDFVDNVGDKWQEFAVLHPRLKDWIQYTLNKLPDNHDKDINELIKYPEILVEYVKESPWYNCCAEDLNWPDRVKLQSVAQKHIDHAISSTLNLPEDVSVQKVADIYETAWRHGCKGITIYRKNCRTGVLVDSKAKQSNLSIHYNAAPKRPKELTGRLHFFTVKGDKYYVAVGFLNDDQPYEIFTGFNKEKRHEYIPKDAKEGVIVKNKRGDYTFKDSVKGEEYKLNNGHSDESADALTRLISCALRHGSELGFIVHQLEKTEGDLTSFSKCLARTLKCYIKDGTKISGESCDLCGSSNIQRDSGCYVCKDCGGSKCS